MLQQALEDQQRVVWRWMLIGGILSALFGVVLLFWPGPTVLVLSILIGLQLVFWGLMLIFERALNAEGAGGVILGLIGGVLAIMLGFAVMRAPIVSAAWFGVFLGAAWLVAGLFETIEAFTDSQMSDRGWTVFLGALTAISGVIIMSAPLGSLTVLALWGGILMVINGVLRIIGAFQIRNA